MFCRADVVPRIETWFGHLGLQNMAPAHASMHNISLLPIEHRANQSIEPLPQTPFSSFGIFTPHSHIDINIGGLPIFHLKASPAREVHLWVEMMLQTPIWELGELRLVDFKWKQTLKPAILGQKKTRPTPQKKRQAL